MIVNCFTTGMENNNFHIPLVDPTKKKLKKIRTTFR
jgi:hypothetical protein